jgi:hypothetical protein
LIRAEHAALIEFRPPDKEEEGHSLLAGVGGKEDTQDTTSDSKQPSTVKELERKPSLDGEVGVDGEIAEIEILYTANSKDEEPWLPYIKPNMTMSMVQMFEVHNLRTLPAHMDGKLQISHNEEKYYPVIFFNEFWSLKVCIQLPVWCQVSAA